MKQSHKTLLLWGVLILMFLAIWQFLSPEPGHARAPAPPAEPFSPSLWIPGVFVAAFVALYGYKRLLRAARAHNEAILAANVMIGEGRFDDAEARVADLEHSRLPQFRRMFHVERALLAMSRGDRDAAIAALPAAIDGPVGRLFRSGVERAVLQGRSLRAFLRASTGDASGAREDIAAVRAVDGGRPREAMFLARASLAEARLLDEAGDRAGLAAVLERDRWILLHATSPRERALVRAYESMLDTSAASVYRQRADRVPVDDDAAATAAWVARFAPNAAPFVRTSHLPAGKTGEARAEVPSEDARRKVLASRPQGKRASKGQASSTLTVWVVIILFVLGVWGWSTDVPADLRWPVFALVSAISVGLGLWMVRGARRRARDAERIADAFRALEVGEPPRAATDVELEAKTATHRTQAAHVLAEAALRRGDPVEALKRVDEAFVALAELQGGKLIAPVAPAEGTAPAWDFHRILAAQRAFALAALGRADEAWAEIEWAKGFPNGHPVFHVLLVTRLLASDYEGAARVVEARDASFAMPARDQALAEMARFIGRPAARTTEAAARLRAELRRDRALGPWLDAMTPGVRAAFERAATETDAGIAEPPSALA